MIVRLTLYEHVTQDEHDGCEVIRKPGSSKDHQGYVAAVSDLWVLQAEAPQYQRCILDTGGTDDGHYHSWDDANDRKRPVQRIG